MSQICILVDCDCDGMLSAAMIYNYLVYLNKTDIQVIHHNDKRHGLNDDIISELDNDCKLLIIPDANVVEQKYADILFNNGVNIISLDHHETEKFNNVITINNQHSQKIKNKSLCGTGVTYKFIEYCCKKNNDKYYQSLLDMVAFANIADIMDCKTYENRFFSYYGLKRIYNPFLQQLCKENIKEEINQTSIAWNIIPLINSVQRSDNLLLKKQVFDCFTNKKDEKQCKQIISLMKKQHKIQNEMVKELVPNLNIYEYDKLVIGCGETSSYSGLIANKLQNKYNKPTFVFHQNKNDFIGSCRSPIEFRDICENSNLFNYAAGHQSSFGISINSDNIKLFLQYLNNPDIKLAPYQVIKQFNGDYSIPLYLFTYFDKYKSLWGNMLKEPEYAFTIKIPASIIKYNKINSTIYFDYDGIRYFKEYCTREYRDAIMNVDGDIIVNIIGTLTTAIYHGVKYNQVKINKLEYIEVEE